MSDTAPQGIIRAVGLGGLLGSGSQADPHKAKREREAALAEAYAHGMRDGEAAMLAAFADVRAADTARHDASLAAAIAAQHRLADSVSETLAELAIQIARAVVAAEPAARIETVHSLVAEALAAAPAESGGTVFVAPAERDAAAAGVPQGWSIAADPAQPSGSARAVLGAGALTASLERRLIHLAALLAEES